ncbi:MAG: Asp-tRNA(Asn)/Glu-tRNA(Gln) amidotransferase subunit GatC [Verrucomicrobiales bacterium]|nr:Asp-tRNA(Asn)/Glu-tRNA(Gln) amidotransferase subunit GatC [Verrucomicrobiales bacterium]
MDVTTVANLARLALTPEETARFQTQLDHILGHIEQLNRVDVSGIEATAHANPILDVMRADEPHGHSFSADEALANAPERSQDQFRVVKVVE